MFPYLYTTLIRLYGNRLFGQYNPSKTKARVYHPARICNLLIEKTK